VFPPFWCPLHSVPHPKPILYLLFKRPYQLLGAFIFLLFFGGLKKLVGGVFGVFWGGGGGCLNLHGLGFFLFFYFLELGWCGPGFYSPCVRFINPHFPAFLTSSFFYTSLPVSTVVPCVVGLQFMYFCSSC